MAETFITILTAHLLGDFVLQSGWMIQRKRNFGILLLHVCLVTLLTGLLLGNFQPPVLLAVLATHLVMDSIKTYLMRDTLASFLIDQLFHLAVIACLAKLFPALVAEGWWPTLLEGDSINWYFAGLSLISGIVVIVPAGGIVIGRAVGRFLTQIPEGQIKGLDEGGRYIGWLERALVMLLLLINQPGGIGFLIAAKSILRFSEIKDSDERKIAEYIIIGTFLSFGWALLFSVLTQKAIGLWLVL
jgi:hypothetical protein